MTTLAIAALVASNAVTAKYDVAAYVWPAKFEQVLRRAKAWSDANPQSGMPKLITVNSWNEWTEGSYLEPDTINGFGYLEAVRRAVEDCEEAGR